MLKFELIEAFTRKKLISYKCDEELEEMEKIFGKLPRSLYSIYDFDDSDDFIEKFTVEDYGDITQIRSNVKKALRRKINSQLQKSNKNHENSEEVASFVEFLSHMLHLDPKKRKTAAELLSDPWLTGVI